jgi:copper resistance protein D
MEPAVVLVRLVAFAASVVLFGTPLFLLYSLPAVPAHTEGACAPSLRPLLATAAGLVLLAAAAALLAQTAVMADDAAAALDPVTLRGVLTGSGFGTSVQVRAGAGLAALLVTLCVRPQRLLWAAASLAGATALAALAWGGHGAADAGLAGDLHTLGDLIHLLAAGMWLGALAALTILLREGPMREGPVAGAAVLCRALQRFSGVGSVLVAAIVASGLVNSVFLGVFHAGPGLLPGLLGSAWGWLLTAKLVLFAAMLGLACLNRFRLAPGLAAALNDGAIGADHAAGATGAGDLGAALRALRRSVLSETAAGAGVLVLVAVLGVLPPPGAG